MMRRGLIAFSASYPSPHFSSVPGRKFSSRKSASPTRRRTMSCPSGSRRLAVMHRLPRATTDHQSGKPSRPHSRMGSPCPGGSTLITSAPMSAKIWPQNGPAMSWPSSMTRRSVSGPVRGGVWVMGVLRDGARTVSNQEISRAASAGWVEPDRHCRLPGEPGAAVCAQTPGLGHGCGTQVVESFLVDGKTALLGGDALLELGDILDISGVGIFGHFDAVAAEAFGFIKGPVSRFDGEHHVRARGEHAEAEAGRDTDLVVAGLDKGGLDAGAQAVADDPGILRRHIAEQDDEFFPAPAAELVERTAQFGIGDL